MAGELRHKDVVGGKITENEYEDVDQHILNNQAKDDLVVATSATQLGRLAVIASRIIAKLAAGNVKACTPTEIRTLLNVEDGATADQTGAEIKTAYEAEANAFTDAKNTKLAGIATGANVMIWKDVSELAMSDLNRAATLNWTALDLTAFTSANAKFAIITMRMNIDAYTNGDLYLKVRKNGTTPTYFLNIIVFAAQAVAGSFWEHYCIIGLDAGQVIEYEISITGVAQIDTYIEVLGYIE